MKILLISGHGDGDPGASSKFGVEATETVVMVQKIKYWKYILILV